MRRTVADHQQAVENLLRQCWANTPGGRVAGAALASEQLPLNQSVGRVLAVDLMAPMDLPPFANSQMDGYAIWSDPNQPQGVDLPKSTAYRVVGTIPAGSVPEVLLEGMAAPIMTGAMVPSGANAVIPIEDAVPDDFGAPGDTVMLPPTAAGSFVREQGSDVRRGEVILTAGTLLNAAHLGLAAGLGLTQLPVNAKPRVLLLTTGDEVLSPGDPRAAGGLPVGMIFDANETLLRTSLEAAGMNVVRSLVVKDDPGALLELLDQFVGVSARGDTAEPRCELIISVGGISAGAFEVVKQALTQATDHGQVDFGHVAMQPGGPQAAGTYRGIPFLGFPGNPVSAFVSFEVFLRPALSTLIGAPARRQRVVATLEHAMSSPAGKLQIRRGIYSGPEYESAASVREIGGPQSHLLGALAQANALITIPAGVTELQAGAKVEVLLL
ncbi:molybdopterin molybdochelatase [Arthrobacter alpinus]|uniref:Molybdopterin molybdenumtransferase n=1 Tax=Arthrobacter alpinus TaxID=656366 RepID=A0A1H5JVV1_9MICC|nr:gephyrin-like molybdotransferase Glp [Arthrobacter alpinus]SEE56564.1 molybdopterin molybdochelatase [Arthrobacter alpinus]